MFTESISKSPSGVLRFAFGRFAQRAPRNRDANSIALPHVKKFFIIKWLDFFEMPRGAGRQNLPRDLSGKDEIIAERPVIDRPGITIAIGRVRVIAVRTADGA